MIRISKQVSVYCSYLLFVVLILTGGASASGAAAGEQTGEPSQSQFNIDLGAFVRMAIPVSLLEQSTLIPIDGGVMVVFRDGGTFDASVLRDSQAGFPGADMRKAPEYMFREQQEAGDGGEFEASMQKMGQIFVRNSQPVEPLQTFDFRGGKGYLLEGRMRSLLVLGSQDITDHLIIISAKGIPGRKIVNWISQGARTAGTLSRLQSQQAE